MAERILIEEDKTIVPLYQSGETYPEDQKVESIYYHSSRAKETYKDAHIIE